MHTNGIKESELIERCKQRILKKCNLPSDSEWVILDSKNPYEDYHALTLLVLNNPDHSGWVLMNKGHYYVSGFFNGKRFCTYYFDAIQRGI